MTEEPTPFVKFQATVDPAHRESIEFDARLRWWVSPAMWIANHLLRLVVKNGVKLRRTLNSRE